MNLIALSNELFRYYVNDIVFLLCLVLLLWHLVSTVTEGNDFLTDYLCILSVLLSFFLVSFFCSLFLSFFLLISVIQKYLSPVIL